MKKSQSSANFSAKNLSDDGLKSFLEFEERVRYSETDRMGVAHNKNYFEWFEIGRTEYCRQKNISYKDIEEKGYYFVVVEAFCRYKRPLRYDERFIIRVALRELTPRKVIFDYELVTLTDKKRIASGYTIHVSTNARGEVRSLPPEILAKLAE